MKHKYLIFGLSAILVVLIIAKVFEPTKFPIRINYFDYAYTSSREMFIAKKMQPWLELRAQQNFKDIPWDGFSLGENSESVRAKSKNTTDSTIILNGNTINARVIKFFSPEDKLIEIDLEFRKIPQQLSNEIVALFGENHLEVYEYNDRLRKNVNERFFWIKDSTLVVYEIDRIGVGDSGYLTIADISDFSEKELNRFIRYGHISSHIYISTPILQDYLEGSRNPKSYTPSRPQKKYGDSDVYQGSSKQKEDLELIDSYFGF